MAQAVFAHYSEQYGRMMESSCDPGRPFREQLDGMVAALIRCHDEDPSGLMLLGQRHVALQNLPADRRQPLEALTECIATAVAAGEIPQQDARISAGLFAGAMVRLAVLSDTGFLPTRLEERLPEIQSRMRGLLGLS